MLECLSKINRSDLLWEKGVFISDSLQVFETRHTTSKVLPDAAAQLQLFIARQIQENKETPKHLIWNATLSLLCITGRTVDAEIILNHLFIIGSQACTSVLLWTLHCLARYPHYQIILQEEMDSIAYPNQVLTRDFLDHPPPRSSGLCKRSDEVFFFYANGIWSRTLNFLDRIGLLYTHWYRSVGRP